MFYLLDKPKAITSFSAIKEFAKENNISKVGHTGTLDPLASGLLLIATDEDTKLIEYVDKGFKTYRATMELGKVSNTYDIDGVIQEVKKEIPIEEEIDKVLLDFVGVQEQMPPAFSAKKINGKKAYDLAREGKEVKLQTAKVEIKSIKNINHDLDQVTFDVIVSRGTYIRSLIHDVGNKLGCGAIMTDLRRTKIGHLSEKDVNKKVLINSLISLKTIKSKFMKEIIDGKEVFAQENDGTYALEYNDDIFGVVKIENNKLKGVKLIGNKFRKAGIK